MKTLDWTLWLLTATLVFVVVGLTVVYVFGGLFVDESVAVRALEAQGYTDITIESRHWFLVSLRGCDRSDAAMFKAVATILDVKKVRVLVCVGFPFKAATIRFPSRFPGLP